MCVCMFLSPRYHKVKGKDGNGGWGTVLKFLRDRRNLSSTYRLAVIDMYLSLGTNANGNVRFYPE